jgi:type VI secretion system protein ImpB
MADVKSVHGKLEKVRKPRVHISYDVETEGGELKKELPFVVGVLGDFSGKPTKPQKTLKERKFTQVDGDNFDSVMKSMTPGLKFNVDNTLKGDGSELAVDLKFESMTDFEPARVAEQVEPLKKLLETRAKLNDLMSKADISEKLEEILEKILQDTKELEHLSKELGIGAKEEKPAAEKEGE